MGIRYDQSHNEVLNHSRTAKRLLGIALDACKAEDMGIISASERRELIINLINDAELELAKAIRSAETTVRT